MSGARTREEVVSGARTREEVMSGVREIACTLGYTCTCDNQHTSEAENAAQNLGLTCTEGEK